MCDTDPRVAVWQVNSALNWLATFKLILNGGPFRWVRTLSNYCKIYREVGGLIIARMYVRAQLGSMADVFQHKCSGLGQGVPCIGRSSESVSSA